MLPVLLFRRQLPRLMLLLSLSLSLLVLIDVVLSFQFGYIVQLPHHTSSTIPIRHHNNYEYPCRSNNRRCCVVWLARDRTKSNYNNNNHQKSRYNNNNNNNNNNNTPTIITPTTTNTRTSTTDIQSWYPNIWKQPEEEEEERPPEGVIAQVPIVVPVLDLVEINTLRINLEQESVTYIANQIRQRLRQQQHQQQLQQNSTLIVTEEQLTNDNNNNDDDDDDERIRTTTTNNTNHNKKNILRLKEIIHGRFMDLTCTKFGETILENLLVVAGTLLDNDTDDDDNNEQEQQMTTMILRGAIMVLQSLCVMGTQVGVTGPTEQLRRRVEHLLDSTTTTGRNNVAHKNNDYYHWTKDSVRRLKYNMDRTSGIQLLAALQWKQTPQGAFDLLVALRVWTKHEDLALLRSGFPIRFTNQEESNANRVLALHNGSDKDHCHHHSPDPDTLLGLRQDLRHLKVYTIDGADAAEIDDGISMEVIDGVNSNDTSPRHRIWIHIADAESYAAPDSELFEMARRRVTSLYLPNGSVSMFPTKIGTDLMSLKVNEDIRALSLGVEINSDGSVNESTIVVTPSLIKISYRLTYDEVDEMLEEGIGYNEEWAIGALLIVAKKRREFRIRSGSSEGMVPNPVPTSSVSIYPDENSIDSIGITINIEVSHNAAMNKTASAEHGATTIQRHEDPASSAYLLVTEAMILAGEAIGIWKKVQMEIETANDAGDYKNTLRLPYRTQNPPDFKGRARERNVMMNLLDSNAGMGLCHAWYTRRFLESVSVKDSPMPHSGLGLSCYVQWSSPIRRFSDLQVHAAVKRYLRRSKVYELLRSGEFVPNGVRACDLGIPQNLLHNGRIATKSFALVDLDQDLNYMDGIGLVGAAKKLQRQSQQYWLFEYIRRVKETNPETTYSVVVLGCVDPDRFQFAIYVKELGLEHRYVSPAGRMEPGTEFRVRVDRVTPRSSLLSFVRVV